MNVLNEMVPPSGGGRSADQYAETSNECEENEFTTLILEHQRKTSNQLSIVTISSIEPYTDFRQYATDLSNSWGVGRKKKNNWLTIIFSKTLREVSISTGLGFEKKLSDEACKKIIDEKMIPNFKQDNYALGIKNGLKEIIRILESP